MVKANVVISYKDYVEYKQILAKIDALAKMLNIDHYELRYLILKEFANNQNWQNELKEKLGKNG